MPGIRTVILAPSTSTLSSHMQEHNRKRDADRIRRPHFASQFTARAVSSSLKMNLIKSFSVGQGQLNSLPERRSDSMRLLITFAIIVGLAIAAEHVRPQCSMANMTGVEWLQCLIK